MNDISLLKSLKGFSGSRNKRAEGLLYIFSRLKEAPSKKITAERLSQAIGISQRGALKMLQWFVSQGFLSTTKYRFDIPLPLQKFGITHILHRNFYMVVDVLKKLMDSLFGKVSSATIIEIVSKEYCNTKFNSTGPIIKTPFESEEARGEQYRAWIKAGRTDLWEADAKKWEKEHDNRLRMRAVELLKARGLSDEEALAKAHKAFPVDSYEPVEEKPQPVGTQSILHFMTEPRIEELSDELDKIDETLMDLEEQRDLWTPRQKGFWFGLRKKKTSLCQQLKALVMPIFNYKKLVGAV